MRSFIYSAISMRKHTQSAEEVAALVAGEADEMESEDTAGLQGDGMDNHGLPRPASPSFDFNHFLNIEHIPGLMVSAFFFLPHLTDFLLLVCSRGCVCVARICFILFHK
jgi:hypothetical protein